MTRLLVAGKLHPSGEAKLEALRLQGMMVDYVEEISESSYQPFIAKADALVIRTQPLSAASIAKAENLKVVSRHGVGYDAVDVAALNARAIPLCIVGDVNSISVAEHAMMLLLAAAKRVILADHAVRDPAQWGWRNRMQARELTGKRLLIIGFGRAGRHLARMAQGFQMQVRAYDPFLQAHGWPDAAIEPFSQLEDALAWADCLSLHVPRNDKPILGANELQKLRPGAIIVNTARGGVVDEQALIAALQSGHIGAAGLDVFDQEPPDGTSPLRQLQNLVLTPHIAGLTDEAAERMALSSIDNALAHLQGRLDPNLIVNWKQLHV